MYELKQVSQMLSITITTTTTYTTTTMPHLLQVSQRSEEICVGLHFRRDKKQHSFAAEVNVRGLGFVFLQYTTRGHLRQRRDEGAGTDGPNMQNY